MSKTLKIFIDGACRGNPGPAGIGIVFFDGKKNLKEISKAIGEATNNIAEYSALIFSLIEALALKAERIQICSDSELVCRQLGGKYKIKNPKLKFLYDEALTLFKCFKSVEIKHIPREENKQADRLATGSLKNIKSSPDDRPEVYLFGEESPSSKG